MRKNYKKYWNKLKSAIEEDLVVASKHFSDKCKSDSSCVLGEAIEYRGIICANQFVLKAMEELDGRKHHNIFSFKKDRK